MMGVFFLALALFTGSFIRGIDPVASKAMPFYNLVFRSVHEYPILNRILTIAILIILGYMLIRIGVRYILLEFRSYMPAVFLLLFTMAHPSAQQISPVLIGSVFYLFTFAILFDVGDKSPDTFSIFTAALILAFGSMFYLNLIWFVPLIWISLGTLRSVTWRELVYPIIAFALLALFLFTWYWVIEDSGAAFIDLIVSNLHFKGIISGTFQTTGLQYPVIVYYGFFLLLIIIASIYMIKRFQSRKTVVQNIFQVLFYMFIAGILFFLFIEGSDLSSLLFIAFPVAFIMSNYLHRKRNHWLQELVMWILVGLVVYTQILALT